jgi:MFS family permease
MACLDRCLARVDARCIRFHYLFVDHGADLEGFGVPLVNVPAVFTITLWLRLLGATTSGWLADRVGRKIPLMISILWYSICNFIAGFPPRFCFYLFSALCSGLAWEPNGQPGQHWRWDHGRHAHAV